MKNIAIIGLGKVGSLVATLLSESFTVTAVDQHVSNNNVLFKTIEGNVHDTAFLESFLSTQHAVVSCLPYNLNLPIARAAYRAGIHYFDLTEDVATTDAIRKMAC